MNKAAKYWIGGIIFFCMLVSCCLCSWFFYSMTTMPEFRESYCQEFVSQGNSIEAEPFGWCK
jgi:hypothetical protein